MRLDQRRADRALIVGEPDADAGFLARLGLAVFRPRQGLGDRRGGGVNAMGRGVRVMAVAGLRCRVGGLRRLRHVLGPHQSCDDLERAVIADGGDAAGDREVLAPEGGPGLDGALELVEAGLDAPGLLEQFLGPVVVVEVAEFVVPGLELLDLGLLFVGGHARLRLDAAVASRGVPVDLDHGGGPLPAGRQLVHEGPQLGHGEVVQEHRVLEPDAVLVLVGEQVAQHLAAGGLVVLHPDEAGDGGRARHPFLGQHALHLPCRGPVALSGDLLPDRHLAGMVGGHREGLEGLEVDLPSAVGVQQLGRGVAEPQPLLDQPLGRAEARGDRGNRLAGRDQLRECGDLVGRVHGDADEVLGEREFGGLGVPGPDLAGHGMVGVQHLVLDQRLHGLEAASAGDHGELPGVRGGLS